MDLSDGLLWDLNAAVQTHDSFTRKTWISFKLSEPRHTDEDRNSLLLQGVSFKWVIKAKYVYLPGGSVVKYLPAKLEDVSSIPGSGRSPGKGNGKPLQCSFLGNSVDRGAWWTTVHRIAKNWTCLATKPSPPHIYVQQGQLHSSGWANRRTHFIRNLPPQKSLSHPHTMRQIFIRKLEIYRLIRWAKPWFQLMIKLSL